MPSRYIISNLCVSGRYGLFTVYDESSLIDKVTRQAPFVRFTILARCLPMLQDASPESESQSFIPSLSSHYRMRRLQVIPPSNLKWFTKLEICQEDFSAVSCYFLLESNAVSIICPLVKRQYPDIQLNALMFYLVL